jgi:hypothetical protein
MTTWRSGTDRMTDLEQELTLLKAELQQYKEANETLQEQYKVLKLQNERLLKKEAEHQNAKQSLIQKRIILSRAVILVPQNLVIGDRLENCVIKIYRGNNVTITDTAELVNCRIIGLNEYSEDNTAKVLRQTGTIEIKGVFLNADPKKFAISTYEKVQISPGARVFGNICAGTIVVGELTKVRGRLATRDLLALQKMKRVARQVPSTKVFEVQQA